MGRRLPNDIAVLASTPLFRDLSTGEVDAVQRIGTVVDLATGRNVRCPEAHPAQFAIVIRGEIAATTKDGRRRVLRAGDWFGALGACGRWLAEPERYETLTETTLFVMSRIEFVSLNEVCPRLAARFSGLFDETREIHLAKGSFAVAGGH